MRRSGPALREEGSGAALLLQLNGDSVTTPVARASCMLMIVPSSKRMRSALSRFGSIHPLDGGMPQTSEFFSKKREHEIVGMLAMAMSSNKRHT
jgi:hypothetical protein